MITLRIIAEVRGIEDENRIAEIGGLCGINEVMHMSIGELSKGYKQRVGLAQSMIHDPEILILDEPTSGLDPNQIIEIRNLIREIGKKKTIILSTHILPEVEATCDRVIIIDRGSIVADDRTENLQSGGRRRKARHWSAISGADYRALWRRAIEASRRHAGRRGPGRRPGLRQGDGRRRRPISGRRYSGWPARKNWILYEMMQEQRSLERVFRELTGGRREMNHETDSISKRCNLRKMRYRGETGHGLSAASPWPS